MADRPLLLSSATVLILGLFNPNLATINCHSPKSSLQELPPANEHRYEDITDLKKDNASAKCNTDGGRSGTITNLADGTCTDGGRLSGITSLAEGTGTDGNRSSLTTRSSTSSTKFSHRNRSCEINDFTKKISHNNRSGLTSQNFTAKGADGSIGNGVTGFTNLTKVTDGKGSGSTDKLHEQEVQNAS